MRYYLVSTGGVGSCAVERWAHDKLCKEHLGKRWSAHTRDPLIYTEEGVRVLYIFGNPYNQLLSFFRRGFMKAPYLHCQHVGGLVAHLSQENQWEIGTYLTERRECYKLRQHFEGWWGFKHRQYDIMFIRYETIPNHINDLREWFGIEERFEFVPRASDFTKQSEAIQAGLVKMFGDYKEMLDALPDVTIKKVGQV